jgi:hypothetical protein
MLDIQTKKGAIGVSTMNLMQLFKNVNNREGVTPKLVYNCDVLPYEDRFTSDFDFSHS